jgi:hypothetical protein
MLRAVAVVVAVLSSTFAISQSPGGLIVTLRNVHGSCPVEFTAQRSGGPVKMTVDSGTHLRISQQVLLRIGNITPRNITQMSVTVHGLAGRAQVMPVVADNSSAYTRATKAELKLAVAAKSNAETNLRVDGITSIRTIDLDSVQYDDGSEWIATSGKPCSIEPNGFMLVSAQ